MDIRTISLARIITHERNLRRDLGDLTELADSIAERGLVQPIVVAPVPDDLSDEPCYVLIAGHRRVAAAVLAPDVTHLPAILRTDLDTDSKVIEAMLIENLQRSDLSPMEEAAGYEQLTLDGYDVERISKATGRSASTVRSRLHLAQLPSEVQTRVHEGQLTLAHAEALAEFADDPELQEKVARCSDPEWHIRRERNRRADAAKMQTKLAEAEARGVRVIRDWDVLDAEMRQRALPVYQLMDRSLSVDERSEKHEAECEHHAVAPAPYVADVEPWCLQPDVHPKPDPVRLTPGQSAPGPAESDAEREARAEREAEFRAACETAQEIRHEWLRDRIRASKLSAVDVCQIMAAIARQSVEYMIDADRAMIAGWLGVTVDGDGLDWYEADEAAWTALSGWLDTASMTPTAVRSPAKALLAVLAAGNEPIVYWRWVTPVAEICNWIALLEQLGYKPSDWEREQLDAAAAADDPESGGSP